MSFCLNELQEKAKVLLTSNSSQQLEFDENVKILYQMIEDFIRETDRYMETERKTREDLYLQVITISTYLNIESNLTFVCSKFRLKQPTSSWNWPENSWKIKHLSESRKETNTQKNSKDAMHFWRKKKKTWWHSVTRTQR